MYHHWLNAMRRSVEVAYFGELKLKHLADSFRQTSGCSTVTTLIQVEVYPFDFWILFLGSCYSLTAVYNICFNNRYCPQYLIVVDTE